MTLLSLLDRARIKTWDRWTWFTDVALVGDSLMVPNERRADTITRCFLPALQEHYPALTITVVSEPVKEKAPPKPRPSQAFKKGYQPAAFTPDLLGGD